MVKKLMPLRMTGPRMLKKASRFAEALPVLFS